jgi:superfamily II DNA/RNA helicase
MATFDSLNLLSSLKKTLAEKGLTTLTDIQARAMPALLECRSVVGVAETGSGKTLAYALPVLHLIKLLEKEGDPVQAERRPRAAVIVPTRELGEQVTRVFKPFTHTTRLRVRSVLGGTDADVARRNAAGAFDILIATPGRLIKLMATGGVKLDDVRVLVFDEADQMLDQGFMESARQIVHSCPRDRQMALFSATVSPRVQELIATLFSDAEVIRSQGSHQVPKSLRTQNLPVPDGRRFAALAPLLEAKVEGGTILFTNTREQCDRLARELKDAGYSSVTYRGEMDKIERRKNLKLFREGKIPFLISTDLASRGLDVEHVGRVINYHLPQQMENYLHRAGRTARAGREGLVINFVTERDQGLIAKIGGLGAKRAAAARGESAKDWPAEPAHKPRAPKPSPKPGDPRGGRAPEARIVVKRRK